jgi:hypothetical protein
VDDRDVEAEAANAFRDTRSKRTRKEVRLVSP